MNFHFSSFSLQLKRSFSTAHGTRSSTPAVLVEIEHCGITGYGEASLPPYLGETEASVTDFLRHVRIGKTVGEQNLDELLGNINQILPGNRAAKAAVDIALHDWIGKDGGFAWHRRWGLDTRTIKPTSFTLAVDTPEGIHDRLQEATAFRFLKVKLGTDHDRDIVGTIRRYSNQIIRVDVNEGWKNKSEGLKMIEWLAEQNTELVEQPLPKEQRDDLQWLKERSPLPLIADEGAAVTSDLSKVAELYDGVNVKLMKSGGMAEAHRMIRAAKRLGLTIMIGCMTETSCGISAAAQLAPLADWVDLDGALLIDNDPFVGATLRDGYIVPTTGPGIGVTKRA